MIKHTKTATVAQSTTITPPSAQISTLVPSTDGQLHKANPVSQEMIRHRAYQKWEDAGKPVGNGICFWLEAEKELPIKAK